jgi:hypothetical protein
MVLLHDSVEAKKFDVRMIERNINRGVVTQQDVQTKVNDLPDDSENADFISLDALANDESSGQATSH